MDLRFTPALARLDVHSLHDRTKCYAKSFYAMGQGSQVWARGSVPNNPSIYPK